MSILKLLSANNFITFNKTIAKKCGVHEAILLGELCSFFSYFNYQEFYVQQERIADDTALSVKQIRNALNNLEEMGIITITKKGVPCKNYYFINEKALIELLEDKKETSENEEQGKLDVPKLPNCAGKNGTTSKAKKAPLLNNKNLNNNINNKNLCSTEQTGQTELSKVEQEYLQNYQDLFQNGLVNFEKPILNWGISRKLTKDAIKKYGLDTVLDAVRKAKENKFCVEKGYVLTTILSAGVFAGLVNGKATKKGVVNESCRTEEIDF